MTDAETDDPGRATDRAHTAGTTPEAGSLEIEEARLSDGRRVARYSRSKRRR